MMVPVWAVAAVLGRPQKTVMNWANSGRLPCACDVKTRRLLVDGVAATELHEKAQVRWRRARVITLRIRL